MEKLIYLRILQYHATKKYNLVLRNGLFFQCRAVLEVFSVSSVTKHTNHKLGKSRVLASRAQRPGSALIILLIYETHKTPNNVKDFPPLNIFLSFIIFPYVNAITQEFINLNVYISKILRSVVWCMR